MCLRWRARNVCNMLRCSFYDIHMFNRSLSQRYVISIYLFSSLRQRHHQHDRGRCCHCYHTFTCVQQFFMHSDIMNKQITDLKTIMKSMWAELITEQFKMKARMALAVTNKYTKTTTNRDFKRYETARIFTMDTFPRV